MVIFRPHRGGLDESLRDAVMFDNTDTMKRHIVRQWNDVLGFELFGIDDIVLNEDKPGVNDERCRWIDTRYVCVRRMGDEVYDCPQCIGMWATMFPANTYKTNATGLCT